MEAVFNPNIAVVRDVRYHVNTPVNPSVKMSMYSSIYKV
jgi:hypothetical protein